MATHYELLISMRDALLLSRMLQDDAVEPAAAEPLIDLLSEASVVADRALPPGRVAIGSQVSYADGAGRPARTVTLVLPAEARVSAGDISVLSPVGLALLGRAPGAEVRVKVPGGVEFPVRILESRALALEEAA